MRQEVDANSPGQPPAGLRLSPDGRWVATYSSADRTIRFFESATGESAGEPVRLPAGGMPEILLDNAIAIVSLGEKGQWVFDLKRGTLRNVPTGVRLKTGGVGFNSDGRWLLAQTGATTGFRIVSLMTWEVVSPSIMNNPVGIDIEGSRFAYRDLALRILPVGRSDYKVEDLQQLASAWSGRRIDRNGTLVSLSVDEHARLLDDVAARFPGEVGSTSEQVAAWHRDRATEAENASQPFAAIFHLRQLLRDVPDDQELTRRLADAERQLAQKRAFRDRKGVPPKP